MEEKMKNLYLKKVSLVAAGFLIAGATAGNLKASDLRERVDKAKACLTTTSSLLDDLLNQACPGNPTPEQGAFSDSEIKINAPLSVSYSEMEQFLGAKPSLMVTEIDLGLIKDNLEFRNHTLKKLGKFPNLQKLRLRVDHMSRLYEGETPENLKENLREFVLVPIKDDFQIELRHILPFRNLTKLHLYSYLSGGQDPARYSDGEKLEKIAKGLKSLKNLFTYFSDGSNRGSLLGISALLQHENLKDLTLYAYQVGGKETEGAEELRAAIKGLFGITQSKKRTGKLSMHGQIAQRGEISFSNPLKLDSFTFAYLAGKDAGHALAKPFLSPDEALKVTVPTLKLAHIYSTNTRLEFKDSNGAIIHGYYPRNSLVSLLLNSNIRHLGLSVYLRDSGYPSSATRLGFTGIKSIISSALSEQDEEVKSRKTIEIFAGKLSVRDRLTLSDDELRRGDELRKAKI